MNIKFDYFYKRFINMYENLLITNYYMRNKWAKNAINIDFSTFACLLPSNIRLSYFEKSLEIICDNYVSLINLNITKNKDVFIYLNDILNTMDNNEYQESFLWFIQFFCRDYLEIMNRGNFNLSSSNEENQGEIYQITLNSKNKMIEAWAINMTELNSTKKLLEIVKMEKEEKLGPILGVKLVYRKDI